MDDSLIESILERPDAARVAAELRRCLRERAVAALPKAARLAAAEADLAKAARLMRKVARLLPDDPRAAQLEALRRKIRKARADVRADLDVRPLERP